jgi:hypothetical protein
VRALLEVKKMDERIAFLFNILLAINRYRYNTDHRDVLGLTFVS